MATLGQSSKSVEKDEALCIATLVDLNKGKTYNCYYSGSTHKRDQIIMESIKRNTILHFPSAPMKDLELMVIDQRPRHSYRLLM